MWEHRQGRKKVYAGWSRRVSKEKENVETLEDVFQSEKARKEITTKCVEDVVERRHAGQRIGGKNYGKVGRDSNTEVMYVPEGLRKSDETTRKSICNTA